MPVTKAGGGRSSTTKKVEPTKVFKTTVTKVFTEWVNLRTTVAAAELVVSAHRDGLKGYVEENGYPDERGSLFVDLPRRVGDFIALKNERRVSNNFNPEKAKAILARKGLTERCTKIALRVTDQDRALAVLRKAGLLDPDAGFGIESFIDEDSVRAALFDKALTETEFDQMFDESVTFAFNPVKG